MYKSFILPHFDYADIIWDNCAGYLSNDLEQLHLDALRTIIGTVRGTSHQKIYSESGFSTLRIRRQRHKLVMFFKLVNLNAPFYLLRLLPPLVAQRNPYNLRNPLTRDVPFCRTELYRRSFFPSTSTLWNNLPDSVKRSNSLSSFKRYLIRPDTPVPKYYYSGEREPQVVHTKLRLGMSDLNAHLFQRHISDNCSCACGYELENARHYLLDCPLYAQQRTALQPYLRYPLRDLLNGNPSFSRQDNENMFTAVQLFIRESRRFVP